MAPSYAQVEELHANYKNHPVAGLRICEKRLSRDSSSIVHRLAYAMFLQDLNRDSAVLEELETIDILSPNVDPEILSGIQETIAQSRAAIQPTQPSIGGSFLLKLWTSAIEKAKKKEIHSYRQCMFQAAVRDGYWDLAQQVFAWLQKEQSSNGYYHFMWIVFTHLRANSYRVSDPKTCNMLEALSFRSLENAVANTLNDKATPRKIQTIQQLRLLVAIYNDQSRFEELLKVLENPLIGVGSDLVKGDSYFKRLKVEVLVNLGRHKAVYEWCFTNLSALLDATDESSGEIPLELVWVDDSAIWTYLIDAATEEECTRSDQVAVLTLIERYLAKNRHSRNAACAGLYYKSNIEALDLPTECLQFFYRQCTRPSCFDDLRGYLEDLEEGEAETFLESARAWIQQGGAVSSQSFEDWALSEINLLKMTYMLCISKGNQPQPSEIVNFTRDCLLLFQFCRDHSLPIGNEAATLAAVALFRMIPEGPIGLLRRNGSIAADFEWNEEVMSRTSLVQAVTVLQYLNETGPFSYPVVLLLLRAYLLLGLGSLAMAALNQLNLKEVQNETAKYLFYTRISTIHPFPATDKQSAKLPDDIKDPLLGCMNIQPWYSRATQQLVDSISEDLGNIPFDKVLEYVDFKKQVHYSTARMINQIEQRRMARLRDETSRLGPRPYILSRDFLDEDRSFDVFPDFEHSLTPSFDELSSAGPTPGLLWVSLSTHMDLTQTVIQTKICPGPSQAQMVMFCRNATVDLLERGIRDCTSVEHRYLILDWEFINRLVWDLILVPNSPSVLTPEQHMEIFNHVREHVLSEYKKDFEPELPIWTLLHYLFTELELLKAWEKVCELWTTCRKQDKINRLSKQPSIDQINSLRKDIIKRAHLIQDSVRVWKNKTQTTGVQKILDMMKKDSNLEELLGAERLQRYAKSMRDSAIDAFDGLIKVRVGG